MSRIGTFRTFRLVIHFGLRHDANMKRLFIHLALLTCWPLIGWSNTLYKCTDNAGLSTFSNFKREDRTCVVLSRALPTPGVGDLVKRAEQGDATAQTDLAKKYLRGEGVPKDVTKTFEWMQKAAVKGNADGQIGLGFLYGFGDGVPKDPSKAFYWFQKAAAQGNDNAESILGDMYVMGEGVSRNYTCAYALFNLSAAQGNEEAKGMRESIEAKLSSIELGEGQRLSSNWRKGHTLQGPCKSASGWPRVSGSPVKLPDGR